MIWTRVIAGQQNHVLVHNTIAFANLLANDNESTVGQQIMCK